MKFGFPKLAFRTIVETLEKCRRLRKLLIETKAREGAAAEENEQISEEKASSSLSKNTLQDLEPNFGENNHHFAWKLAMHFR